MIACAWSLFLVLPDLDASRPPIEENGLLALLGFSCYGLSYTAQFIMQYYIQYIPCIVFVVVMGNYIYKRFQVAAAYYFTRTRSQGSWLTARYMEVLIWSELYMLVYIIVYVTVLKSQNRIAGQMQLWWAWICVWQLNSIFLWLCTLLVNLFSILWGSGIGLLSVYGGQIFFIGQILLWGEECTSIEGIHKILYLLNPVLHSLFGMHQEAISVMPLYVPAVIPEEMHLWTSFLYLGALGFLCCTAGIRICRHRDYL